MDRLSECAMSASKGFNLVCMCCCVPVVCDRWETEQVTSFAFSKGVRIKICVRIYICICWWIRVVLCWVSTLFLRSLITHKISHGFWIEHGLILRSIRVLIRQIIAMLSTQKLHYVLTDVISSACARLCTAIKNRYVCVNDDQAGIMHRQAVIIA